MKGDMGDEEKGKFFIDVSDKIKLEVRDQKGQYAINLNERLLQFAVDILQFLMTLPLFKEFDVIRYQLSKSATSIGANYKESQAGSYGEFSHRIQICLREAKETLYWLKIIKRLEIRYDKFKLERLERLLTEANEITLIFGSISAKIRKKSIE